MTVPKTVHPAKPKTLPKSLGFSKYSLDFVGDSDDEVDIPYDPVFQFSHESFTVCLFVYMEDATDCGIVGCNAYQNGGYAIAVRDGGHRFGMNDDTTEYTITPIDVEIGKWVHLTLAFDYSTTTAYAYKNGKQVGSMNADITDNGNDLFIGHSTQGGHWTTTMAGKTDEVMVFDEFLTESEVREIILNYHTPPMGSLVGWWRFEEGTGLTAYDKSGNGNDGDLLPSDSPPTWEEVRKWELRAGAGL